MLKRLAACLATTLIILTGTTTPAEAHTGARSDTTYVDGGYWWCGFAHVTATNRWDSNHHVYQITLDITAGRGHVQSTNALYGVNVYVVRGNGAMVWSTWEDIHMWNLPKSWWPNYIGRDGYIVAEGWVGFDGCSDKRFRVLVPTG